MEESKDADEFASALSACGGSFTNCTDPSKLGATSITIEVTTTTVAGATTTTVAGATPTTVAGATTTTVAKSTPPATLPAGVTLAAGKGAIAVTIWVDSNRDGSKGTAEKALPGTTVTVKGPNGVTKTATTNADGVVSFVDLDPGSWSVVSVLSASGYEKVYDSDGKLDWESTLTVTAGNVAAASYAAAPASGATTATLPAGVTLAAGKGAIEVTTWVDANRNGKQSSSEKSLSGMKVTIKGPNGVTKTASTNSKGVVSFIDLEPGDWSVVSVLSASGYEKVYDSDGKINWRSNLTVTAGNISVAKYGAAKSSGSTATAGSGSASGSATLSETGTRSTVPLTALALSMLAVGAALVSRRRRTV